MAQNTTFHTISQTSRRTSYVLTFSFTDHHVAVLAFTTFIIALHFYVIRCFWLQVIYQVPLLCTYEK